MGRKYSHVCKLKIPLQIQKSNKRFRFIVTPTRNSFKGFTTSNTMRFI